MSHHSEMNHDLKQTARKRDGSGQSKNEALWWIAALLEKMHKAQRCSNGKIISVSQYQRKDDVQCLCPKTSVISPLKWTKCMYKIDSCDHFFQMNK